MKDTFHNPQFKLNLIALILRDEKFLIDAGELLDAEDFKPSEPGESNAPWLIVGMALDHWTKYREPIGAFLAPEIKKRIKENAWGKRLVKDLRTYYRKLRRAKTSGSQYILDNLVEWRRHHIRTKVISDLIDLHGMGNLTDQRFMELCTEAVTKYQRDTTAVSTVFTNTGDQETDFKSDTKALYHRSLRRKAARRNNRHPLFLIPPLDAQIRGIGRGNLGMVLAPTGRGKSMTLAHIGVSLALQGWNVLYFTLEDALEDLEDRVDTFVSNMRIKDLAAEGEGRGPGELRDRFLNFRRGVQGNLRLVDCTKHETTLSEIEAIWDKERQQNGWTADAIIIDYDQVVSPRNNKGELRHEIEELYVELVHFARRNNVLIWTASQTNFKAEDKEGVLSGMDISEHKGKLRHCTLALSIGRATKEWLAVDDEARYLGVMKHRSDKSYGGCHIISDPERMRIFDYDKTQAGDDRVEETKPEITDGKQSLDDLNEEDELL